ncbi:hypothetical protein, partial [Burkholderia pseudomallei]
YRFVGSSVRRFVGSSVRRFVGSSVRHMFAQPANAHAAAYSVSIAMRRQPRPHSRAANESRRAPLTFQPLADPRL